MRYEQARTVADEIAALDAKAAASKTKRLGKRDALARNTLAASLHHQPPPTPRRAPTGLDANGFASGDRDGSRWAMRLHTGTSGGNQGGPNREARRANRFGRGGIKPFRSRIQRQSRRQRTGGVK